MKLVVFGASGGTGGHVVEQALASGHGVTAVARDPSAIELDHEQLDVRRGDVLDPASLEPLVTGKDAVLSALGVGMSRKPTNLYSAGTRSIIGAMKTTGVQRLVAMSAGGFVDDPNDTLPLRLVIKPILKKVLKHPYADMALMENELRRSNLDWTIIRPARLTDGSHTGRYRTAAGGNVPGGWTLSRADIADFMVTHLDNPAFYNEAVGIAY